MIEIKTKNIIIGIIVALVLCFLGGWALGRFQRDDASRSIIQGLNDVMRTYTYRIGDLRKEASEKDAIITTQRQAIREGLLVKEELRKLKVKYVTDVTHFESEVNVLLDSIAYFQANPPINTPCPPDENYPVLYLPLAFHETNKYLNLQGNFDEDGKLSMDISLPLVIDIFTGWDRTTKKYKTVITYDQPYLKIIDIKSVQLDLQKHRRWGIGIVGGYGVGKDFKLTPYFGVGLTRLLVSF